MSKFKAGNRVFHNSLRLYGVLVRPAASDHHSGLWHVVREGALPRPCGYTNTWNEVYLELVCPAAPPEYKPAQAEPGVGHVDGTQTALATQIGGNHYKKYKIQPIEYAHANKLGPCEFNVLKYITRHKDKNGLQDLQKARHMIDVLIALEYPAETGTN